MVGNRREYPIVLIVCEGQATEPTYFNAITDHLRLAAITIRGAKGSAPLTVVQDAVESKEKRDKQANHGASTAAYDQVWCVFDVDQHPKLKDAIALAARHQIKIAMSNPCFEYWLLLHFERFATTRQSRNQMRRQLGKHISQYRKGGDYGHLLLPKLKDAVGHAADIWKTQWKITKPSPSDAMEKNPSTLVHTLIEYLTQPSPP